MKTDNQESQSKVGMPEFEDFHPIALAWELGYTIAVPLVVFALVGRFADTYFNSSPWLLLGGILLSIFVSSFLVYKKTVKILK